MDDSGNFDQHRSLPSPAKWADYFLRDVHVRIDAGSLYLGREILFLVHCLQLDLMCAAQKRARQSEGQLPLMIFRARRSKFWANSSSGMFAARAFTAASPSPAWTSAFSGRPVWRYSLAKAA